MPDTEKRLRRLRCDCCRRCPVWLVTDVIKIRSLKNNALTSERVTGFVAVALPQSLSACNQHHY